jgi:hypothetical protein
MMKYKPKCNSTADVIDVAIIQRKVTEVFRPSDLKDNGGHYNVL